MLRLRRIAERQARGAWGTAEGDARTAAQGRDKAIGDVLAGLAESRDSRSRATLDPAEILAAENALDGLRQLLAIRRARAVALQVEAENARETWRAANADVEGLERLEERDRERHRSELEREEQRELDERAISRFPLKRSAKRAEEPDHGS